MTPSLLEISAARRDFADRAALQDVSLTLAAGDMVALLGPNGAGKTTLMRAIAGRLRLESGTVKVCGKDPNREPEARSALGLVPQNIALYPNLSARENLDVFARLMGVKGAAVAAAVDEALMRAGLVDRQHDLLTELSGGMQRRLNIVAATLHKPQLLLLDEPTVGVDRDARERVHSLLRGLRNAGMGILISTHDFDQAAAIGDRVVFMHAGRILADGKIADLVAKIFGQMKELAVSLAVMPAAAHVGILQQLGLHPVGDDFHWSGPLSGGAAALPGVETRLVAAGMEVDELRLRQPGLESVYTQLMHEAGNV
jgi:ABC-2 type transport system ATP-binding protein